MSSCRKFHDSKTNITLNLKEIFILKIIIRIGRTSKGNCQKVCAFESWQFGPLG